MICCEGNAGFYEIGIMATPISLGYSTLGWNHPGFYGSTGTPYPEQETMAVDAVMQFAIHKLGFKVENILVTGWSIGGFSSTWLAMNYPEISGLVRLRHEDDYWTSLTMNSNQILDATFDDLLPLAVPRMPASLSGIVTKAVKKFINLNVGEQLAQYPGPVRIIRRDHDEMICTRSGLCNAIHLFFHISCFSDGELWSNRGNNLILSLLQTRYPGLCSEAALDSVTSLLYTPGGLSTAQDREISERLQELCQDSENELGSGLSEDEKTRLLCYITTRLVTSINTTHCTPLPSNKFQLPWTPASNGNGSDFEKVDDNVENVDVDFGSDQSSN